MCLLAEADRALIADHLSVEELGRRARTSADACAARHYQAIWLLAQWQPVSATAAVTGFVPRWLEQLASRYNQFGPEALGDRRRRNGARARPLTPELLDRLRRRLETPPPDGGVWTTTKIAVWMAQDLGLVSVYPQRAWDALQALGWSIQAPRPENPAAASPASPRTRRDRASRPGSPAGVRLARPRVCSARPHLLRAITS